MSDSHTKGQSANVEIGKIYSGKVAKIMDYGAFVTILPGKDGLVHISQISSDKNRRVNKVSDELNEGDSVQVKVLEIDQKGRIRLSMREATNSDAEDCIGNTYEGQSDTQFSMPKDTKDNSADVEIGKTYSGKVARIMDYGAFVTILPGKDGLVHISQISNDKSVRINKVSDEISEGDSILVKVLSIDEKGRISLSMREAADDADPAPETT